MKSEYGFQEQISKHAKQERLARKILSVDENADSILFKKASRVLAKKYHPDKNQGDDSALNKFKKALNAYEFLTGITDHFDFPEEENVCEGRIGKYQANEWGYFCHWKEVFMDGFV